MDNIFCDILSFISNAAISGITLGLMKSKWEKLLYMEWYLRCF